MDNRGKNTDFIYDFRKWQESWFSRNVCGQKNRSH